MTYREFNYRDRLQLEVLLKKRVHKREIAALLGFSLTSIYREIKRGKCEQLSSDLLKYNVYSADVAQADADEKASHKGRPIKLGYDYELAAVIADCIINKGWSPAATLGYIRMSDKNYTTTICVSTLYSYLYNGYLGIKKSASRSRTRKKRVSKMTVDPRFSIHRRSDAANARFPGHWEIDTVIGRSGSRSCLLVFTERHSRYEIIRRIPDKSAASVAAALRPLVRKYRFKSLTSDNGTEFRSPIVQAAAGCPWYFCDPYCSCQRGSNENANRLIRRFFPKGTDFARVSLKSIRNAETWINNLPRGILGYNSASDVFACALSKKNSPRRNSAGAALM